MAIQVDGYGNITQGNAKEIYTAWKRGEIDLNKSQQTKCESFLSPEDMDEVQYDDKVTEKRGRDSIDTEGADSHGGQGGNAAVTSVGMAAGAAGAAVLTKTAIGASITSGLVALGYCAAIAACSSLCLVMAKMFDNGYKDRTAAEKEKDQTNQTMDNYSDALGQTMEMMNDDVETYKDQQDFLTTTVNTQASKGASLQMQYDAAVAMGDTEGAQVIKEQMKALAETDNSDLEEGLEETSGAIEEYRAMNAESLGCAESGQSVSDFLKQGKPLGIVATVDAALLAAATIYCAIVIGASLTGGANDAAKFNWPGLAAGIAGSILAAVSTGILGYSTAEMIKKAKGEFECGSAGSEMQEHVNTLNDMAAQQDTYTTDTEGQFAESDEAAAEAKDKAAEAAADAVGKNSDNLGNKPKPEDKKDKPAPTGGSKPAPTGAAA